MAISPIARVGPIESATSSTDSGIRPENIAVGSPCTDGLPLGLFVLRFFFAIQCVKPVPGGPGLSPLLRRGCYSVVSSVSTVSLIQRDLHSLSGVVIQIHRSADSPRPAVR